MRWFKHISKSFDDEKISNLVDETGLEGYGFWWRTLEIIAENAKGDTFTISYSMEKLRSFYRVSGKKCRNYLKTLENHGLILLENHQNRITVSCPNLAKFRDEYARKQAKSPDRLRRKSGQAPEKVAPDTDTDTDKHIELSKDNSCEVSKRLFAFWKEVMNKPKAEFTQDRRKKIHARLKEGYSEDDCMKAIENCSNSPYHRGKNKEGREYVQIELIFRNGEKLESFRDMQIKEEKTWRDSIPKI